MSPWWRRGLWLWAGILAGFLCLAMLPFALTWRVILLLCITLICFTGMGWTGRRPDDREQTFSDALINGLPPENYRLPVVLVCGDDLDPVFDNKTVVQCGQGCWLRADNPAGLRTFTRQLLWQRPDWGGQLAVMLAVNPQQHSDKATLATRLYELRWQLAQMRHDCRRAIPLLLSSTIATSLAHNPVWLSQLHGTALTVWPTNTLPETLTDWQSNTQPVERLKQSVVFSHHMEWLAAQVLPALQQSHDDVAPVVPHHIVLQQVSGLNGIQPDSLWQHWLSHHTALVHVAGWHPGLETGRGFPEFVLANLPTGSGVSACRSVLRHGVTLLTLAAVMALCSSAWQNRQLLHRVVYDIQHYYSIPMNDYQPKAKAVAMLHRDASLLNDWFRNGEPLRLGLGLYQGERLRLPLLAAIKTYVPPSPPSLTTPKTVRLDSLSLFDTGKYVLKPGSLKMLVSALVDIKARPGWLIVVAGHTDITGEADANQELSLKRAEALRDWMLSTSDVSPTCFAVQGYGATRPIASNDTPDGRALNRRVEISLVPQANACQAAANKPSSNE